MAFAQQPNGPRGLSPYRASNGIPQRAVEYEILGTYGTKIYSGSPVALAANGTVVVPADVDTRILGIFDGCEYDDPQGNVIFSPFWPAPGAVKAGSTVKCRVYEAQGVLFGVYADADLAQSQVGEYFTLTALSGGSDVTGKSDIALDAASNGTSVVDKTVVLRQIAAFDGAPRTAIVQFIRPEYAESAVFPATA